jgi:hypothetical protein
LHVAAVHAVFEEVEGQFPFWAQVACQVQLGCELFAFDGAGGVAAQAAASCCASHGPLFWVQPLTVPASVENTHPWVPFPATHPAAFSPVPVNAALHTVEGVARHPFAPASGATVKLHPVPQADCDEPAVQALGFTHVATFQEQLFALSPLPAGAVALQFPWGCPAQAPVLTQPFDPTGKTHPLMASQLFALPEFPCAPKAALHAAAFETASHPFAAPAPASNLQPTPRPPHADSDVPLVQLVLLTQMPCQLQLGCPEAVLPLAGAGALAPVHVAVVTAVEQAVPDCEHPLPVPAKLHRLVVHRLAVIVPALIAAVEMPAHPAWIGAQPLVVGVDQAQPAFAPHWYWVRPVQVAPELGFVQVACQVQPGCPASALPVAGATLLHAEAES